MVVIIPFHQRSRIEQEIFWREIHFRKARLHIARDLSILFALFTVLGAAELKLNPNYAEDKSHLIFAYVFTTSLLVSNTVLVKIGLLWMVPELDTALYLGTKTNSAELDSIPPLFVLWDWLWILATSGGFLLFGTQFILLVLLKFPSQAVGAVVIMGAVMGVGLITFVNEVRQVGKPVVDEDKIRREWEQLEGV